MNENLDPARPELYPRRVLVCLAGLNPQVVTETLYALARQQEPAFLPTELRIVSTARGARAVREQLLAGGAGPLYRLQRELGIDLGFDPARHLHLVARAEVALDDIDSVEDNAAVADTVLGVLRPLAQDAGCAIHASIAGGRKSMGFYLGYTLSLLGRAQDRLSHVLVNAPFEGLRDFFYPPTPPATLALPDGSRLDTSAARVALAPVAFVRIADGLGARLAGSDTSFDGLIRRAQAALSLPAVHVAPGSLYLRVGADALKMEPASMAWYCYFATRRQQQLRESTELAAPGMVRIHKDPRRCLGLDQALMNRICRRMSTAVPIDVQIDPEQLRYRVSVINSAIRDCFGAELGARLALAGPNERGKRDGQYGLTGLPPERIRIG